MLPLTFLPGIPVYLRRTPFCNPQRKRPWRQGKQAVNQAHQPPTTELGLVSSQERELLSSDCGFFNTP
ncbi:hypothetical protein ATANTOWER_026971 [Ataeniobius toweri]|uniref:Uncharacterized protein n=1 Tax=Ataeniobius toweri TaxID=208326 RepID=A0ABU7C5V3_9TELE|nr:hypothetical protein [Ataeniobius toweri]